MRQDKTVARIILIFSVANVVLAAPAVVRQRHLNKAEGVTVTSKKRAGSDSEATDGSLDHDWPPLSPDVSFHDGPPLPPFQFGQPWMLPLVWYLHGQDPASDHDSIPGSPSESSESFESSESSKSSESSHHELPAGSPHSGSGGSTPGFVSDLDESMNFQGSTSVSVNLPTQDDLAPVAAAHSAHHALGLESGALPLHGDPTPVTTAPSMYDDSAPVAVVPSAQDNMAPVVVASSAQDDLVPEAAAPSTHYDSASVAAAPSAHNDLVPVSGTPSLHHDSGPVPDPSSHSESAVAPEADRFFNDKLKRKIKIYSALGVAVVGVSAGVIYGVKKIKDKESSRVCLFYLCSLSRLSYLHLTESQKF